MHYNFDTFLGSANTFCPLMISSWVPYALLMLQKKNPLQRRNMPGTEPEFAASATTGEKRISCEPNLKVIYFRVTVTIYFSSS